MPSEVTPVLCARPGPAHALHTLVRCPLNSSLLSLPAVSQGKEDNFYGKEVASTSFWKLVLTSSSSFCLCNLLLKTVCKLLRPLQTQSLHVHNGDTAYFKELNGIRHNEQLIDLVLTVVPVQS